MATAAATKTKKNLSRPMSFSIKSNVLEALTSYCDERGVSRSWILNKALENYLRECLEDKDDYEAAARAWKEFEESGGKTYSSAEVRKELGL